MDRPLDEQPAGGYIGAMSFTFIPVRPGVLLDDDALGRIVGDYLRSLDGIGGRQGTHDALEGPGPIFYLVATGGTEEELLKLDTERRRSAPDEPVFLVAHPSSNSLPAALEVLARLQQEGRRGRIFYLEDPDDTSALESIAEAANSLAVSLALKHRRIGMIGDPSNWLVASSPRPSTVTKQWGPTIVNIEMDELTHAIQSVVGEVVAMAARSLADNADQIFEPSPDERTDVARVYGALTALVERHHLDALTLRCFDLVLHQHTTGCVALARLNDEGIIAGCEGDLVSTVGMLWAHELLSEVPWMANPARLDEDRNTLWLAHCTVPLSLVTGYNLRSHFESGLGVAIQGTLPNQPVTLLRIGGAGMDELWLAEGEIARTGNSEELCRTQVEIRMTDGHVRDLLRSPLGNHLVMVPGHHVGRLRSWWETMIAPHRAQ